MHSTGIEGEWKNEVGNRKKRVYLKRWPIKRCVSIGLAFIITDRKWMSKNYNNKIMRYLQIYKVLPFLMYNVILNRLKTVDT